MTMNSPEWIDMNNQDCKQMRVEIDRIIENERHKVLTSKYQELHVQSDEQIANALRAQGFAVETYGVHYHRTLIGVPGMLKRWEQYQTQINERNETNG